MTPDQIYALAGAALVGIALYRLAVSADALRRVVAVNVLSVGVSSILIAAARRGGEAGADPVPHAFVLTGIVVLVATTAVALALIGALARAERSGDDT